MLRQSFLKNLNFAAQGLEPKTLLNLFGSRLFSLNHYYMLKMNLQHLKPPKPAKLCCNVSEATPADFRELHDLAKTVTAKDKKDMLYQLLFYKFGFRHCYLVRNQENQIIALHWLIYPHENKLIETYCSPRLAQLKEQQIMIDNVFIFPKFRIYGLLGFLTSHILNEAKEQGYKTAITVTNKEQLAVLNTLIELGFRALALKTELRFLGLTRTI